MMNDVLKQTKAMPVSLLLADRHCLVVGGGKIALRKAGHLLDSNAQVTVVCPELCEAFPVELVQHVARSFKPDDVDGMAVVFAATNDRYVNRQILDACRERNVLCSCVDGNWAQSDFTTPAIARHGNLTLTVSTGGQSCRQAKLVKDSLAKHLETIETVELVVVGTDHHHLSLGEREPFHLAGHRQERIGFMLMQLWGVHEFMILNTCNRVEVIAVVSRETAHNGILRHILGFDRLKEGQFYLHRGLQAYEHLNLVTSGMLSQTPGETHISAQFKLSYDIAKKAGWAGNLMQEWVSSFLHVSKHIQTEIVPTLQTEEIEGLALHYLDAHIPDLSKRTLLMLGAGMVGQGFVRDALQRVGKIIWCYHKNKPDVPAGWDHVELCTFNDIKDRIGEADIIISATEAPGHVLHSGHAPFFDQEKQLTLIDLGMPRNIDPALTSLSTELSLIDLDDLKNWHRRLSVDLNETLNQCRSIIGEHQEQYERISNSFQSRNA
jgi:glutamyl-tRNA reductase